MLVVVVVLALLAAVVVNRWSSVHHNAVAASTLGKLEFIDQHLRQFARSRGRPCTLAFDLAENRFRKQYAQDEHGPGWESLGTGVRLDSIRIGAEQPTRKQVDVVVDATGQTPTYGLHLMGPGKRETWLLFAGVSGQMTELESQEAWNAAFDLLTPPSL